MPNQVEIFRKLTGRSRRRRHRRRSEPRQPVPPREWSLAGLLLLNVAWLTFALGGVRLWGETVALALSVGALLLLPRWKTGEIPDLGVPVYRLLKSPLFWAGFGLYLYMYIQTWNLAWEWTLVPDGRPKLVSRDPPVSWLPSGFFSPLEENNPARSLIFFSIPWLACSAAWAGLATRRANNLVLRGIAFLGTGFAFVALRQHFLGKSKILGIFETVPGKQGAEIPFWGTLINENHAAFYLILINGLCFGLFLTGWHRDLRLFRKGGGAWLLTFGFSLLATFAVLMAQARGAILFVVLQWVLFLVVCSIFFFRSFGPKGGLLPASIGVAGLFLLAIFITNPQVFERQKLEWLEAYDLVENPEMEARYYMAQVTLDLIGQKPWLGHGAGSFRYLHLPLLAQYPEFTTQHYRWARNPYTGERERRLFTTWYQNAHVDLLEYLVEWGILGSLFPLAALVWLAGRAIHFRSGMDPGKQVIFLSLLVVLLGAALEFHLRIPLVLLAWCLSLTVTVKLTELRARAKMTAQADPQPGAAS